MTLMRMPVAVAGAAALPVAAAVDRVLVWWGVVGRGRALRDRHGLVHPAACGNSGNSTEPHVHVQAMDRPTLWFTQGRPLLIDGRQPRRDGEVLGSVGVKGFLRDGQREF